MLTRNLSPNIRLAARAPIASRTMAVRHYSSEGPHYHDSRKVAAIRKIDDQALTHEKWTMPWPSYTKDELHSVKVVHHQNREVKDYLATWMVASARTLFDIATRYKQFTPTEAQKGMSLEELRAKRLVMTEKDWMARSLFLESIAGVPGSCASVLRHLRSLRLLKRDGGWIHTLLAEAENERMHLLCFMKIRQPGIFLRAMIIAAQGVFFNAFFLSYLISPSSCHRFVGKLEEEAVHTYTLIIKELEEGRLPEWENVGAPQIAIDYWRMSKDATLLDMIYAIRADESNHRFVNHSLANLKDQDVQNPFAIREPDATVRGTRAGYSAEESQAWAQKTEAEAKASLQEPTRAH